MSYHAPQIRAGIEDPREARDTLVKIVDMKLQASRAVMNWLDVLCTHPYTMFDRVTSSTNRQRTTRILPTIHPEC